MTRHSSSTAISSTVEQYIKIIYMSSIDSSRHLVEMKDIIEKMKVAPGTVTAMMNQLQHRKLITYTPHKGVALTPSGTILGRSLVRRHRLIETFLEQIIGYSEHEVHRDAESLEHVVSDMFIDKIDNLLRNPTTDPHGSPIPPRTDGTVAYTIIPISEAPFHQPAIVEHMRTSGKLAEQLTHSGITLGASITVTERNPLFKTVAMQLTETKTLLTIGIEIAACILVKVAV